MEEILVKCPKCEKENPSDARFCIECGNLLSEPSEAELPEKIGKICPTCNQVSDYDPRYDRWWCANCQAYVPEKKAPEPKPVSTTPISHSYYRQEPSRVEVKQSGGAGWIVAIVVVVILIVIGLIILSSGALSGGGLGSFECGAGTIILASLLFAIPIALRSRDNLKLR